MAGEEGQQTSTPEGSQAPSSTAPPAGYVPQDTVNSLETKWKKDADSREQAAREQAVKDFASSIGVTDPEEIKTMIEAQRQKDQESLSKAEKLEQDLANERASTGSAKERAKKAEEAAQNISRKSEAKFQALALGVAAEYVDAFLDVARAELTSVEVGDSKTNYEVDSEKVKAALQETLTRVPIFAQPANPSPQEEPAPPQQIGTGSQPETSGQSEAINWERMAFEDPDKWEAYLARAKQGEKFSLT